jgi:hypothetical protein
MFIFQFAAMIFLRIKPGSLQVRVTADKHGDAQASARRGSMASMAGQKSGWRLPRLSSESKTSDIFSRPAGSN